MLTKKKKKERVSWEDPGKRGTTLSAQNQPGSERKKMRLFRERTPPV